MKVRTQKCLTLNVALQVPSTIEELAALVNGQDKVLELATDELIYRNILPKIRKAFFEKVEAETGVAPRVIKTIPAKTPDGKATEVYEKDTDYIKHVSATTDRSIESFLPLLQAAADEVGFDISASGRATKGTKVDVEAAENIIAAVKAGTSNFDRVVGNLTDRNPGLAINRQDDGSVSVEDLALAIRTDRERRQREAVAGLL